MSSSTFLQMWRREPSSSDNVNALVNVAMLASDSSGLILMKRRHSTGTVCSVLRLPVVKKAVAAAHLSAEEKFGWMSFLIIQSSSEKKE